MDESLHTLGLVYVNAGELLTFLVNDDSTPGRPKRVTIIALDSFNVSDEMVGYYKVMDRSQVLMSEKVLPEFIIHMASKGLVRVTRETTVVFGSVGRPASRLSNEYKYTLDPEFFWEEKLLARYRKTSFDVFNHQGHLMTIINNVDAPFQMTATLIDGQNSILGMLRMDILTESKHTLVNEEDIERLRLALQADITMHIPDLMIMVEKVDIQNNPNFGLNGFKRHLPPYVPPSAIKDRQLA